MSFKTAATSAATGIIGGALAITTVMHNAPIQTRIAEIDMAIEKLQTEKAELETRLI